MPVLGLIIVGIALVAVAAVTLYNVLKDAAKDANDNFGTQPVGSPVSECMEKMAEGSKIISAAQAKRGSAKFDKLPPGEQQRFLEILQNAQSDEERLWIWKAFAACHSVDECAEFAEKIKGKDSQWMQDNLKLTGSSKGTGVKQQWSHSCNATTVQAVKGEMDPIYALEMHEKNPNLDKADDADATKMNPDLAQQQKDMLESEYKGPHGKHSGVAANRGEPGKGAGRWADDLLNENSDLTGVTYKTVKDPSPDDALKTIDSGLEEGVPVPIVIGNGPGQYTHYVLVTDSDPGPPKTYTIHDPWSGETVTRTEDDIRNGRMNIAGSNQITAVEDPQVTKQKPSTKPSC
jgi:hypothetical protein